MKEVVLNHVDAVGFVLKEFGMPTETKEHVLKVRGGNGKAITWEPGDGAVARAEFNLLRSQSYVVYAVDTVTGETKELKRFDPAVERMEAIRPLQGG